MQTFPILFFNWFSTRLFKSDGRSAATYFIILQDERLFARVTQNCHQDLAMVREAASDPPVILQNKRLHHEA